MVKPTWSSIRMSSIITSLGLDAITQPSWEKHLQDFEYHIPFHANCPIGGTSLWHVF